MLCSFIGFVFFTLYFCCFSFHLCVFVLIRSLFIKFLLYRLFHFYMLLCQQLWSFLFLFFCRKISGFYFFSSLPILLSPLLFVSFFFVCLIKIEIRRSFFSSSKKKLSRSRRLWSFFVLCTFVYYFFYFIWFQYAYHDHPKNSQLLLLLLFFCMWTIAQKSKIQFSGNVCISMCAVKIKQTVCARTLMYAWR